MSYHPLGAPASPLPSLPEVPSATQLKADAATTAKQIASDAAAHALEQYPEAQQVVDEFNQAYDIVKNYPLPQNISVEGAKQWGIAVLKEYLKQSGIPTQFSSADLEDIASGSFKAQLEKYGIPPDILSAKVALQKKFEQLAFTAVAAETGIDPNAITVTWDALKDGQLSQADCENLGAAAGSIAGASVAQAFGIPAPIGAWVGSAFGSVVGGTVAEIFSIGDQNAAYHQHFDQEWGAILKQASDVSAWCGAIRKQYWDTFDRVILSTEKQWEMIEARLGWRFQLRYFGPPTTTAFLQAYDPATRRFDGPNLYSPQLTCSTHDERLFDANGQSTVRQERSCTCTAAYGCLYPEISGPLLSPDAYSRRVTEAFLLRGAVWLPDSARALHCDVELPSAAAALDGQQRNVWGRYLSGLAYEEQSRMQDLQRLTVLIIADLVQTAGAVAAEKAIYDNRQALIRHGVQLKQTKAREVAVARHAAARDSSFLNWAMLIGGVSLGAYAWRRRHG